MLVRIETRFSKLLFIPMVIAGASAALGGLIGALRLGFPEIPNPNFNHPNWICTNIS